MHSVVFTIDNRYTECHGHQSPSRNMKGKKRHDCHAVSMAERYRFLARVVSGILPFPGPLVSVTNSESAILDPRARPFPWATRQGAPANFVLEVSSTGITAKKFSIGAQLVYIGILVAGLFGGLGLSTLLIAVFGLRSETTPFLVSLGVILLIPFGMIPGAFIGRGVLRMWPRTESVEVQISSVRLGTFWDVLDLVSPRGPLTVRVVSWRKQLEKVLRRNNQMPSTDRVSLEGFRI